MCPGLRRGDGVGRFGVLCNRLVHPPWSSPSLASRRCITGRRASRPRRLRPGPAAAINAGMGQNAFLMAALLVGGFRVLRTCPALGGAILGLLTMKPQFWLLVPVALAAGREWRALLWSVATAIGLALLSLAMFG